MCFFVVEVDVSGCFHRSRSIKIHFKAQKVYKVYIHRYIRRNVVAICLAQRTVSLREKCIVAVKNPHHRKCSVCGEQFSVCRSYEVVFFHFA